MGRNQMHAIWISLKKDDLQKLKGYTVNDHQILVIAGVECEMVVHEEIEMYGLVLRLDAGDLMAEEFDLLEVYREYKRVKKELAAVEIATCGLFSTMYSSS